MTLSAAEEPGVWSRRRLLAVLAATGGVLLLLLAGLIYAVVAAVTPAHPSDSPAAPAGATNHGQGSDRDAIAAAAMWQVPPQAALPTIPSAVPAEAIVIPPAARVGAERVPSGFPRTPQGAVGQLAAIGTTVLQGMSIEQTNAIYAAWALPGGSGPAQWEMTRNVQAFLGAARMGAAKDTTATVTATPVAAQIKGVDGPDWTLACVLLDVRAVIQTETRMGYGWCERMQWHDAGWRIGPGPAPAQAPSTWPGSEASIRASWKTWTAGPGSADATAGGHGDTGETRP